MDNLRELLKARHQAIKLKYGGRPTLPNHHVFLNGEHYKSFKRRSQLECHMTSGVFKKLSEGKSVEYIYSRAMSKLLEEDGKIVPQK